MASHKHKSGIGNLATYDDGKPYGSLATACHTSPARAFTIGGVHIFGGAWHKVAEQPGWDLVFRLRDTMLGAATYEVMQPVQAITANGAAKTLLANLPGMSDLLEPPAPVITLDWPDFSIPSMPRRQWGTILDLIRALPSGSRVVFSCDGGHGRTGTALSILTGLAGLVEADADPVAFVRAAYCRRAVESEEQTDYIESVTGMTVNDRPSYVFDDWKGHGHGSHGKPAKKKQAPKK